MRRKHTKSFLLVSAATTLASCGGSTEDGERREGNREASANDGTEVEGPAPTAEVPNAGATLPVPRQVPQVEPPGMSQTPQPEPFVGLPLEPDYAGTPEPVIGDAVEPQYGGSGGMPYGGSGGVPFAGAGAGPVYVGDPVEPDYGGAGGSLPFPGEPVEPDYGGAGGSLPFPGEPVEPDYGGAGGTHGEAQTDAGAIDDASK